MNPAEVTYLYVRELVDALAASGLRHVCLAPGSRSTPLAMVLADHPGVRLWTHVDERSCAFFALGMARGLGEPVAVVCTSGTAAANFYPAVIEARYARVPLVVLTADRPPELRDVGASQAIDQLGLYGPHVKWFADAALPEASGRMLRYARVLATRAVRTAAAEPAGPVHLNFPFREPLVPQAPQAAGRDGPAARSTGSLRPVEGRRAADPAVLDDIARWIAGSPRPLFVLGPQEDPRLAALTSGFAARVGAPLLADPLSQARWGRHELRAVVDSYDLFLRDEALADRLRPTAILRLGAAPVSKALLGYLERLLDVPQVVVDPGGGWRDPALSATQVWPVDPVALLEGLSRYVETPEGPGNQPRAGVLQLQGRRQEERRAWLERWLALHRAARQAARRLLSESEGLSEARAIAELVRLLPDGSTLYAGNSMPVRDLDGFAEAGPREIRALGNRGASGIDGVVSSALGVAAVSKGPVALAIGDLSFYHDLNGLLAARLHSLSLTVLLLHNDGGGIFSLLPQADHPQHFEQLFGTPTGLDFRPAVEMYGGRFTRVASWGEFQRAVRQGLEAGGLSVVEVRTERSANAAHHRRLWDQVVQEVRGAVGLS
ncbi:2-succinyl-5-enolpyruvyl-6-hydroxy-3-cyclohexene-1-carboxylic-acid synthase [Carboxydochorda subterranea]|uniref:2-succinyl-5-enolpyruvyl-6-hydroxy-3-cyclohexene-1-carboxylate synthase n=1 Tax=Carboxydichorda subterranea TaxID=3109565 RepID=A0ABZ1BXN5_9FIRM|nr:2-succinyl-5-enolpyruvyl-6-hydroxy-3-cyclohexene-1-carboxylic-acid synthase [Limnochorda sp. L945t]WRP17459.1 2-succinyl-5-enolpyruvyl-6-hydroxy-3-cyclohexene-1-carboxylic-acid synthase [Limnochorda sp. L945t]